jgi:hypothetical protein
LVRRSGKTARSARPARRARLAARERQPRALGEAARAHRKQRALRVARIVDDIVQEQAADTVLLDNIEMLFHPDLKQDPLRLLQSLSRNRTIVATWRGAQAARR